MLWKFRGINEKNLTIVGICAAHTLTLCRGCPYVSLVSIKTRATSLKLVYFQTQNLHAPVQKRCFNIAVNHQKEKKMHESDHYARTMLTTIRRNRINLKLNKLRE